MPKFPFYKQLDQMDCGPTCLRMVSRYYGKHYSLQELRKRTFVTREGVSLLDLSRAAESLGFRTLGAKLTLEQLRNDVPLPCLIHWTQNHFVVVYKVSRYSVIVGDPMGGLIKYRFEEFSKGWQEVDGTGISLILEPTPEFFKYSEEISETGSGFIRLYSYISPYKRYILQLIFGLFIGSLMQLALPFLTQSIVDVGVNTRNINFVYLVLLGQVTLFVGRSSVDTIRRWILLQIGSRINIAILSDFLNKIVKLPLSFFGSKMIGDILQRIDDHARVERFINSSSLNIVFSLFTLLIFGIVLGIYSLKNLLVFLVFSSIYLGYVVMFLRRRAELDFKKFQQLSQNQNTQIQLINGIAEIKINNASTKKIWEWEALQIKIFKLNSRSMTLQLYQDTGSSFINELKNIVITIMTALAVMQGNMTLGMMLSVQYIIGQLNGPINEFIGFTREFQDARLSFNRINEIHVLQNEEKGLAEESARKHFLTDSRTMVVRNVSFQYGGPSSPYVLKDVSFTVPHQRVTAIVGASGSGKTTLMKLLLKFYEPMSGSITVGEQDLQVISHQEWRNKCGVVMQDGYIFSDTIARNIALSDDEVDTEKLVAASKIACIHDFVSTLPLGYNTKLGPDGVGVSVGQQQRILIARAVYKQPDVLFFDEATSSLDAKNERMKTFKLFLRIVQLW